MSKETRSEGKYDEVFLVFKKNGQIVAEEPVLDKDQVKKMDDLLTHKEHESKNQEENKTPEGAEMAWKQPHTYATDEIDRFAGSVGDAAKSAWAKVTKVLSGSDAKFEVTTDRVAGGVRG